MECICSWSPGDPIRPCMILGEGELGEFTPDEVKCRCVIRAILTDAFGYMTMRNSWRGPTSAYWRRRLDRADAFEAERSLDRKKGVRRAE